ncbi:DExH-box ATP-dependent RNA helicase DExH6 [Lathyrus oleraceus]|uniref:RNA helicase n=1 Tax=Pisum sativum TaxID=3888 RepID=A0A9D4WCT9_PEA|nr:DExH-box ATP-dependent RNA helicase DExH6 [Pisum sativum]
MYSKLRAAALPDFQIPELKRMPIEELCMQVNMLDSSSKIEVFLAKTLDPPVSESIHNAIKVLRDIGALSTDETLTDLGEKLGSLLVHPVISRMLFFAILMNCLDPTLTLAYASDYKDPFTLPMLPEDKKRAAEAKAKLASLYERYGFGRYRQFSIFTITRTGTGEISYSLLTRQEGHKRISGHVHGTHMATNLQQVHVTKQ